MAHSPLRSASESRYQFFLLRRIWPYLVVLVVFVAVWGAYLTGLGHDGLTPLRWAVPSYGNGRVEPPPPQHGKPGFPGGFDSNPEPVRVNIPEGTRVIALVFYGRKDLVQVLDCYLKRNLKVNGGLIDEVIFAVKTDNTDDLGFLEELLRSTPHYSKHVAEKEYEAYNGLWEAVNEPDSIYIKIDDDVVYFDDNTIPALAKRLLENPQYFAVSANVVNNPALSWVHYHMDVYEPYWPEMTPPAESSHQTWRASELPPYEGPITGPEDFAIDGSTPAPYPKHRWLPVRLAENETFDIALTPASTLTYDAFGPSLLNWAAAAQTHYSFLQHLENGDTWRYKFDTWDYGYQRLSINFYGIWGRDVIAVFPFPQKDDEEYLTIVRPKEVQRHVVVDGTSLAVHFAFNPQYRAHGGHGVTWTDLLPRYTQYAKEMVCMW